MQRFEYRVPTILQVSMGWTVSPRWAYVSTSITAVTLCPSSVSHLHNIDIWCAYHMANKENTYVKATPGGPRILCEVIKDGLCMYNKAYNCRNDSEATLKIWVNTLHGQAIVIQPEIKLTYGQMCVHIWLVMLCQESRWMQLRNLQRIQTNSDLYM